MCSFSTRRCARPGQGEDFFRKAQQEGVIFVRTQAPEVIASGGKLLAVEAFDELLGDKILLDEVDMVVLATGMVPATAFGEDFKAKQEESEEKKDEMVASVDSIFISDILNLEYRQGPELPELQYGFPDSHFICFPYESRRTGIYAAGPVRRPMGISNAMEDAAGAAMKAIQCVELTSKGMAVHPRAGDLTYPEFFMQRCTQCKRCTEECPFGAINEDEKGNPLPQPTRCRRCSVCMGACPERIISFKNYSVGNDRRYHQVDQCSGRIRGKTARPGAVLRKRRLSGAGYGRASQDELQCMGSRNPASLSWLAQPGVDRRLALQGDRWNHASGMPSRRQLSVPFRQRQRTGEHSTEQSQRDS